MPAYLTKKQKRKLVMVKIYIIAILIVWEIFISVISAMLQIIYSFE